MQVRFKKILPQHILYCTCIEEHWAKFNDSYFQTCVHWGEHQQDWCHRRAELYRAHSLSAEAASPSEWVRSVKKNNRQETSLGCTSRTAGRRGQCKTYNWVCILVMYMNMLYVGENCWPVCDVEPWLLLYWYVYPKELWKLNIL